MSTPYAQHYSLPLSSIITVTDNYSPDGFRIDVSCIEAYIDLTMEDDIELDIITYKNKIIIAVYSTIDKVALNGLIEHSASLLVEQYDVHLYNDLNDKTANRYHQRFKHREIPEQGLSEWEMIVLSFIYDTIEGSGGNLGKVRMMEALMDE